MFKATLTHKLRIVLVSLIYRVEGARWGLRTGGMGVRGAPWDLKGELQEAGGGPQELMGGGEGGRFWEMGNCVCVFC